MKKAYIPVLTRNCILNSEDLIEDAGILFENDKYSRAFALSHLGCEEIAKAAILHVVDLNGGDEDVKKVDSIIRDHQKKLKALSQLEFLLARATKGQVRSESFQQKRLDFVKSENMLKNVALYAGELEGKHVTPREVFSKDYVGSHLGVARQRLEFGKQFCNVTQRVPGNEQFWEDAHRTFFELFRS